jgi:hypothetical protein
MPAIKTAIDMSTLEVTIPYTLGLWPWYPLPRISGHGDLVSVRVPVRPLFVPGVGPFCLLRGEMTRLHPRCLDIFMALRCGLGGGNLVLKV